MTSWYAPSPNHLPESPLTASSKTDNLGYGYAKRRQGNLDVLEGKISFR